MARETGSRGGVGRREFVIGAGALVSSLVVGTPFLAKDGDDIVCRVLLHDPSRCLGCGVCGLMCSLSREGEAGPSLSRSAIVRDPFNYNFKFHVCHQCRSPECYRACPLKDTARVIDDETQTVYVDEDACIGCGSCVAACPYDPPGTKLHPITRVALNCDRCFEREDGPVCAQYCPADALTCSNIQPPRRVRGHVP